MSRLWLPGRLDRGRQAADRYRPSPASRAALIALIAILAILSGFVFFPTAASSQPGALLLAPVDFWCSARPVDRLEPVCEPELSLPGPSGGIRRALALHDAPAAHTLRQTAASEDVAIRMAYPADEPTLPVYHAEPPRMTVPPMEDPALCMADIIPEANRPNRKPSPPATEATGDDTMVSTPRTISISLALTTWFCTMAAAQGPNDKAPGEPADRFQKIERQLGDLQSQIVKKADLKAITDRLEKLEQTVASIQESLKQVQTGSETLRRLSDDLTLMQQDIDSLKKAVQSIRLSPRTSTPSESRKTPVTLGEIQLINSWVESVIVTVDGVDYVLRPGQKRTITRAPGWFTYEVHNIQGPRRSWLAADGRPHTIEIHAR